MGIGAGIAGQVGLADEAYVNEVQGVAGTPSTPFTMTYDGATTAALPTNCSAAQMQAALEALPNILTGGVVCAGGGLPTKITITFSGAMVSGRNLPVVIINVATGLTVTTDTPGTGFGDFVAPTVFPEVASAKPALAMGRLKSTNLRAGQTVQRTDRKAVNKSGASNAVSFDGVPSKGFSKWAKGIFGKAPTITTPSNGILTRKHSFTFGDTRGISQCVQTGVPTVLGDSSNVKAITSLGAKVDTASFKCALDGYLQLDLTYDAMDETDQQALAAVSYASGVEMFHFGQCVVAIGGANTFVTSLELDINNKLATRRGLRGSTLKKEHILNAMRELTGKVTVEFESMVHYDRFAATTLASAIVPITFTFTGAAIETVTGGYNTAIVFTMPTCDIVGSTPTLDGPDLVHVDIPFEINTDGTTEPLTMDLYTTDTTS